MNKLKFFVLAFAFLSGSFTVFSAMSAAPTIINFKDTKTISGTISIDSDKKGIISGVSSSSGKATVVLLSGSGQRSGTFKVTFTEEAVNVKITAQYSVPPDTPADEIPNDSISVGAVSVELTLIKEDNFIAPKICLNAQKELQFSKWKISVLPVGTTATVSSFNNIILKKLTGLKNGNLIIAEGVTPGDYNFTFQHSMTNKAKTKEIKDVVFKYIADPIETRITPVSSNQAEISSDGFRATIKMSAGSSLNAPASTNLNIRASLFFKISTSPKNIIPNLVTFFSEYDSINLTTGPQNLTAATLNPTLGIVNARASGGVLFIDKTKVGSITDNQAILPAPNPISISFLRGVELSFFASFANWGSILKGTAFVDVEANKKLETYSQADFSAIVTRSGVAAIDAFITTPDLRVTKYKVIE